MEPIARRFSKVTGYKVRRRNAVLQHPEYPFMLANVDRLVFDTDQHEWGILEVKNLGEYAKDDWTDGAIPEMYSIQVMHYMAVCDLQFAWLAPLIGGNKLRPVKVERDERLIKNLIRIESDFWQLVESRTPPPIDDSEDAARVLKFMYPGSDGRSVLIEQPLIESLREARARRDEAEREVRGYENQIKEQMKTADYALVVGQPKPVVTWRVTESSVLDVTALQTAEPEVAAKYMKLRASRRFLVK